jgi:hypothetical protein
MGAHALSRMPHILVMGPELLVHYCKIQKPLLDIVPSIVYVMSTTTTNALALLKGLGYLKRLGCQMWLLN